MRYIFLFFLPNSISAENDTFLKSHINNLGHHFALVREENGKKKTNCSEIFKGRMDLRENSFGFYSLFYAISFNAST